MKKSVKIGLAVLAVAVLAGTALFMLTRIFDTGSAEIYYVQIDNSRIAENHSTGGVIDFTGGLAYHYTLPAFDAAGNERTLDFGMSRELREGAFLRLEVMPVRGVVNWEEVQYSELPGPVQARFAEPADN